MARKRLDDTAALTSAGGTKNKCETICNVRKIDNGYVETTYNKDYTCTERYSPDDPTQERASPSGKVGVESLSDATKYLKS